MGLKPVQSAGLRLGLRLWWGGCLLLVVVGNACRAPAATLAPPTDRPPIHFINVAQEVGLDFQHGAFRWATSGDPAAMMGGGLCWLDYDRDGWLDLFVVNSYAELEAGRWEAAGGLPRSALFRNRGGHFEAVGQAVGAAWPMRGNGCVAADFNRDGWTDLYITTARVNLLLWNNGRGGFEEGAAAAGVDAYGWQTGAAVGDLNQDGWPDLVVAGYVDINQRLPEATLGFPNTHAGLRDLLFLSQGPDATGRVTFREVGVPVGLEQTPFAYGLGVLLSDLDQDGDLDLYIANDTNPNYLYINQLWPGGVEQDPAGLGFRLVESGAAAGAADPHSGMGVASGDFDGDGRFDLFITNLATQYHALYRNQSDAPTLRFQDVRGPQGVANIGDAFTGWGAVWGDVDHDSDLDLLVINGQVPVLDLQGGRQPVQLLGNLTMEGETGRFEDWSTRAALAQVGGVVGRGGALADYDNDGDLDLAINTIGGELVLLRQVGAPANWLQVHLDGPAAGAVITAHLPDGRTLRRELHAGGSYLSSHDPRCHLGLGAATTVAELHIRWPDGQETIRRQVAANQILTLRP